MSAVALITPLFCRISVVVVEQPSSQPLPAELLDLDLAAAVRVERLSRHAVALVPAQHHVSACTRSVHYRALHVTPALA